jgi:hypothetical protein
MICKSAYLIPIVILIVGMLLCFTLQHSIDTYNNNIDCNAYPVACYLAKQGYLVPQENSSIPYCESHNMISTRVSCELLEGCGGCYMTDSNGMRVYCEIHPSNEGMYCSRK